LTIIECPMCPWRAGIVSSDPRARDWIYGMHIDKHCLDFREEMNMGLSA